MLRAMLVFAVLIPGMTMALFNRFAALLLYLWFAMFRPQEFVWFDLTSLRLSLIVGLVLVVPSLLTGIFPDLKHPLSLGMLGFLVAAGLAQAVASYPDQSWPWLVQHARLILVSLLAVTLIDTPRRFILTVAVIAGSLGFYSTKAGALSVLSGGVRFGDGQAGAFVDSNGYGLGVAMIMPLLIVLAQNAGLLGGSRITGRGATWLRTACLALTGLSAVTVISTFSRAGFLALAAGAMTLILVQRRRVASMMVLSMTVMVLLFLIPIPKGYRDRVDSITTYETRQDASALGRIHFWRVAVDMSLEHPLGVGLFNYQPEYDRYDSSRGLFGEGRSVHNSYLQALVETGVVGGALFLWLFWHAIRTLRRVRARSSDPQMDEEDQTFLFTAANGLLASLVAFMVGGAFIALALNDLTWLTFALVASLDQLSQRGEAEAPGSAGGAEAEDPVQDERWLVEDRAGASSS